MKVLTMLVAALMAFAAQAQDYPSKPLRFIVPYSPGALTDTLTRVIADRLGTALKQPVLVKNMSPDIDVHTHMLNNEWLKLLEKHGQLRYRSLKAGACGVMVLANIGGKSLTDPVLGFSSETDPSL